MILSLLLVLALTTFEADIINVPLNKEVRVPISPSGRAEIRQDGTLTQIKIDVDRLQPPSSLGPALNSYVVWAVSPEGILDNLGELEIDGNKGQLSTSSRLTRFGIFITAEPHYMVDRPSSVAPFRNQVARDELRRVTVPVEIGAYDYSSLKPSPPAPYGTVAQARMAFQIAQNTGAERLAETEFRNARVALGSMEELLMRAAPLDILWPAANEAIRWSQRAVTVARERETLTALQTAKSELEAANADRQQLNARIRDLAAQQAAASDQIRNLQSQLGTAARDKDELNSQREQAENRTRQAEAELARLKQQQNDLQSRLSVTLREDYFDGKTLTEAGREALLRIYNIAEVVPGPILLEGGAPEDVVRAATEFLLLTGVPQDRIVTRR